MSNPSAPTSPDDKTGDIIAVVVLVTSLMFGVNALGGIFVAPLFFLMGGGAVYFGHTQYDLDQALDARGVRCSAHVTDIEPFTTSEGDRRQSVAYDYDCGDSPRSDSFSESVRVPRKVGERLKVTALPDDPTEHRVNDERRHGEIIMGVGVAFIVVAVVVGALMLLVAAAIVWSAGYLWRRRRRARA